MVLVRQLCGGGLYRDVPYWVETIWFGVKLETAAWWLAHFGWGLARCGCGWVACDHAPLRFRLKGRCWIEDRDRPATARREGELFTGVLSPLPREQPTCSESRSRSVRRRNRRRG